MCYSFQKNYFGDSLNLPLEAMSYKLPVIILPWKAARKVRVCYAILFTKNKVDYNQVVWVYGFPPKINARLLGSSADLKGAPCVKTRCSVPLKFITQLGTGGGFCSSQTMPGHMPGPDKDFFLTTLAFCLWMCGRTYQNLQAPFKIRVPQIFTHP